MGGSITSKFEAGTSFKYASEQHLRFIISDPSVDEDNVLVVNMTTYHETPGKRSAWNDPACILEPSDHIRIEHTSCIYYGLAEVTSVQHLEWRESLDPSDNRRVFIKKPAADSRMLTKMRQGALDSDFIEPRHLQVLIDQRLVTRS